VLVGGGDAGAHVDAIDSFSHPGHLIAESVRQRGLLPLEVAIRLLTSVPADLFGLCDRGRVVPGAHADLAVFDAETYGPGPLELRRDLPGGAARLYSEAIGLEHVLVNGTAVVEDGTPTEALPGQVLRS
jgi:N-acyl-D-aspartate/D-glutamate deacylase